MGYDVALLLDAMSMKRTPEWYADYQMRRAKQIGNIEMIELKPIGGGFVEPVPVNVLPHRPRKLMPVTADDPYPNLTAMFAERGIYPPVREYPFARGVGRQFRFDYAWPTDGKKVALEIDGGVWMKGGGGHSHPMHILRDIEKHNLATMLGWRVIRATPDKLDDAVRQIELLLGPEAA